MYDFGHVFPVPPAKRNITKISLPTGEGTGEEEQTEPRCATSQTRSGSAVAVTHWLTAIALADQWGRDGAYKRGRGPGFCSF
ncbi:UNVERIFIED_CONTAM: hypothetical protein FKN15_020570 [Acipenser sinensis]